MTSMSISVRWWGGQILTEVVQERTGDEVVKTVGTDRFSKNFTVRVNMRSSYKDEQRPESPGRIN